MNPFLNEIFHILYPIYCRSLTPQTSQSTQSTPQRENQKLKTASSTKATMDGYLYYIFGIVVRDIRSHSRSSIGDIIHEMKESNNKTIPTIPHAYELLFKSVELTPSNW